MDNQVSFLEQRSVNSIRKEINNIIESYSNFYDVLCELTQNSFDAIQRYNKKYGFHRQHKIIIEFNVPKRKISIYDTGVGISSSKVKDIVAPNSTDKDEEFDSIGEKGVGLTYTIFSCEKFIIETQNENSYLKAEINNASSWRRRIIDDMPKLSVVEEKSTERTEDTFTRVSLERIDQFDPEADDVFNHSIDVLEYILRTKTIIGYLKPFFENNNQFSEIDVELDFTNYKNESTNKKLILIICYLIILLDQIKSILTSLFQKQQLMMINKKHKNYQEKD